MKVELDYATSGTDTFDDDVSVDEAKYCVKITATGQAGGGGWPMVTIEGDKSAVMHFLISEAYGDGQYTIVAPSVTLSQHKAHAILIGIMHLKSRLADLLS